MNIFLLQAQARKRQSVGALFTTASEVKAAKDNLNAQMTATQGAFSDASLAAPPGAQVTADYTNWHPFFVAWQSFWLEDESTFTASSDMDRVNDYAAQLKQWQAILAADSQAAGVTVTRLPTATGPSDSGGQVSHAIGSTTAAEGKAIQSIATPLVELGLLGLAIWGVVTFGPELTAMMRGR